MVQIIRRTQPSPGERFAAGLERGLGDIAQLVRDKQARNALASRFGEEFKNIRDPNIQKLMVLQKLRGESETAKQQQTGQALQKAREIYENPDLSLEEKIFGIYEANPELARNLLGNIESGERLQQGSKRLEGQKSQEERLRLKSVANAYKSHLGLIDSQLKNKPTKELKNLRDNLIKEQTSNLRRLKKGEEPQFHYLEMEEEAPFAEEDEGLLGADSEQNVEEILNGLSDEEIAELFEEAGGDLELAKQIAVRRYLQ